MKLPATALAPIVLTLTLLAPAPTLAAGQCFNIRAVSGRFTRVDHRTVNLGVNGKDVYQLQIIGPCGGIDWAAVQASLRSRTGGSTVCRADDIDLYAPSPLGTRICRVQQMRKLTTEEIAALPRGQRP